MFLVIPSLFSYWKMGLIRFPTFLPVAILTLCHMRPAYEALGLVPREHFFVDTTYFNVQVMVTVRLERNGNEIIFKNMSRA